MTDVVIVGAGPVGLLLAALLGRRGRTVLVLEKKEFRNPGSNAIGITPPSLALLATLGLDTELVRRGAPIRQVTVHGKNQRVLGKVGFRGLPTPHDFILSVPQSVTEEVLSDHLKSYPTVRVEYGWEFVGLKQTGTSVTTKFKGPQDRARIEPASFVAGCDGPKSMVREALGLPRQPKRFDSTFLMGDFSDHTGWGDEAHLFFTPRGAVEAFPLGGGKRRWIVQTPEFLENPGTYLEDEVEARTGIRVPADTCTWKSPFGIHRWISSSYAQDRVYLAGDSAHQMSPIGGQGMNTGFADAEFAAAVIDARLNVPEADPAGWNRQFTRVRRRAGKVAAARAELSMAIGTVTGPGSTIRNGLLSLTLHAVPGFFPPHYGMLTVPGRNLAEAKRRNPRILSSLKEFS